MSISTPMPAAVLALACAVALSGCGDPKAPSADAFATALAPVVKDRFCVDLNLRPIELEGQDRTTAFPVVTSPTRTMFGPGSDGKSAAMLDAAAALGFVSRKAFEGSARSPGSTDGFVRQKLISYEPTPKGSPYLRTVERKATNAVVSVPSFCIARGEVADVVRWSEPMDFGGRRVSRVTYTYRGVDPMPGMPPAEQARLAEPKEATTALELQSDGWRPVLR